MKATHHHKGTGTMERMIDGIDAGWGNKILKVRGMVPIVVVLLGVSLYFAGTMIVKQTDAPTKAIETLGTGVATQHGQLSGILSEQRAATEREHAALIRTQERIADSLDAQVFYLSKTEKERAQYKIEMPDSLRRKLVDRGDGIRKD
jgi:hypothetical protein